MRALSAALLLVGGVGGLALATVAPPFLMVGLQRLLFERAGAVVLPTDNAVWAAVAVGLGAALLSTLFIEAAVQQALGTPVPSHQLRARMAVSLPVALGLLLGAVCCVQAFVRVESDRVRIGALRPWRTITVGWETIASLELALVEATVATSGRPTAGKRQRVEPRVTLRTRGGDEAELWVDFGVGPLQVQDPARLGVLVRAARDANVPVHVLGVAADHAMRARFERERPTRAAAALRVLDGLVESVDGPGGGDL